MVQSFPRTTTRLLSLLVGTASLLGALLLATFGSPLGAQASVSFQTGIPSQVVTDTVEEWSAGNGLVSWAKNCNAEEGNSHAELKSTPISGGTVFTVAVVDDSNFCVTFENLLALPGRILYFDQGRQQIEEPSGKALPLAVKTLNSDEFPIRGRQLVEAGGFLYWAANSSNRILRVRTDGSGTVATVADTADSPLDVMVVGNVVYWTDSTGVWLVRIDCGTTLPCSEGRQKFSDFGTNTSGYGLLYQFLGTGFLHGNYRVYWVEGVTNGANHNYQIRYRSCNQNVTCVLFNPQSGDLEPLPEIFYTATINWQIGNPLLTGGQLYWTEADLNNSATGDIRRKLTSLPLSETPDTIATNQANIDDQLYTFLVQGVDVFIIFARRDAGIYTLSADAFSIYRNFDVEDVEVTQGIQDMRVEPLDVPLIAKKATFVRFYGVQLSGPNTANVEARLIGLKDDVPLPEGPLQPINLVRALVTGAGFDRAKLNDSWNFLLPPSWTEAGTITLRLEIDPRRMHLEQDPTRLVLVQPITFHDQPPVCVWTVPVSTHTDLPSTTDPNFFAMISQFERRWPVPAVWVFRDTEPVEELEFCTWHHLPYPCHGPYELGDGWGITNGIPDRSKVLVSLWARALLSYNPDVCDDIGAPVHYMGMVHPDADNGGNSGFASMFSTQSWVQLPGHVPNPRPVAWYAGQEGGIMAQELAHNYGRKHVDCNNPPDIDDNYPYPPCQIGDGDPSGYYGFDIASLQPIPPKLAADFMSYDYYTWVSDYTWRALLGDFMSANAAAAAHPMGTLDPDAAGDSIFVTGLVDTTNNRGRIAELLVLPTTTLPPATRQRLTVQAAALEHEGETHAVFQLRLLDANEAVLLTRTLTLTPLDIHSTESTDALFSDLFPKPAGQVATIQLLADNTVIDTRSPGVNLPMLSVQQPVGGALIDNQLTMQWTGSDPDPNDRLIFTVQYSHDNGASWHTVALDVPSTPDPSTTLTFNDLGSLHGSGPNTALLRVLATDGYNTKIATSQPFTLKNRPPEPVITTPGAGQTLPAGQAIVLQGSASDAEDGGLADGALTWQVDGSNSGSGPDVTVVGLAPGLHSAALGATDTNSQTVTATVSFNVAPLPVPLAAAPALDGFCDEAGYAAGASLQLKPYSDGAQANVRVLRDDDYLWICFSGLQKGAPAPGGYVGVRADIDNSRHPLAQPSDAGFFVGENGIVFTKAGDGAGGFEAVGPEALQAQVSAFGESWSAELCIDQGTLGGWEHLLGLSVGHYSVAAGGDDYPWPYAAQSNKPNTWATTALGSQPLITAFDAYTATMLGPSFTLTVEGSGFVSGTVVLWAGSVLPTTYITHELLIAQVADAQLANAALVQVTARSPAPGNFVSNALPFVVEALTPRVTNLSPGGVLAEGPTFSLTVTGNNFATDAQVLWNGTPLATQFVSATQVKVQIDAALLAKGQTIGIAVRNQQPDQRISPVVSFDVQDLTPSQHLLLPMIEN